MANPRIDILWCKNNENRFITSGQDLRLYQINHALNTRADAQGKLYSYNIVCCLLIDKLCLTKVNSSRIYDVLIIADNQDEGFKLLSVNVEHEFTKVIVIFGSLRCFQV